MMKNSTKSSEDTSNYQMRPNFSDSFKVASVKEIICAVMQELLEGKEYSESEAAIWTREMADITSRRVKELKIPRYKHIVQVLIAQYTGAGCRYIARCRWDAEADTKISEFYKSESIVCVVTVFGVYLY